MFVSSTNNPGTLNLEQSARGANVASMAWSPRDAVDAEGACTLLDVLKTSYRILRGGEATPSPALKRRRSAGTPFAKATNRAARQDMP